MNRYFERLISGLDRKPPIILRPYQERVLTWFESLLVDKKGTYTLRQARQSGKNEICAYHHYRILSGNIKGEYLAFAPTYAQTTIAKRRLTKYIDHYGSNYKVSDGKIYQGNKKNITFLTASPTGNILGHTASIGITLDEAQEVRKDVFENKILPMTASTSAPIVMVGTAGYQNDILYEAMKYNEMSGRDDMNINITAEEVANCCPSYATHYEGVVARYGKESLLVKTQYDLIDISAGGGLLTEEQVRLLLGRHTKEETASRAVYVMAIDIGGSSDNPSPKNDETVVIIARLIPGNTPYDRPAINIVKVLTLQGVKYDIQEQLLSQTLSQWNPVSCIVDARGIGEMMAESLHKHCPAVVEYKASSNSVNTDIHSTLGYLNRGLLSIYMDEDDNRFKLLDQARTVGYEIKGSGNVKLVKEHPSLKIDMFKAVTYLPRAVEESGLFSLSIDAENETTNNII